MSILLKGFDMPKENEWITISIYGDGTVKKKIGYFRGTSDIFTDSAVEVPTPHGDLVDRNVVAENIRRRLGIRSLDYLLETEKPIAMSIKEAPAIIESEE